MYIKNNTLYSPYEFLKLYSNISFPNGIIDDAFAEEQGFSKVTYGEVPTIDEATQKVVLNEVPTLISGSYVLEYSVVEKTVEEIEAYKKALVPQTITKLQAMKQLKVIDKWNTLKAILASDEDVNDEWVVSDNLNRTYPLVLGMAQALGISDEELDTLFIEASKL